MPFSKIRNEKTTPKIVLVGNFGAGNVGDELILAGFLKKLTHELSRDRHTRKARVTVLAANPQSVRRWHGVTALPTLPCGLRSFFRWNWWRSIQEIKHADLVIFPGGGLFTDEESWLAVLLWGLHILVARYFWKPVYLLGQSVGPLTGDRAKQFTRFCLKKVEWIALRDKASETEFKQLGVPAKKIKQGKDSAFWLAGKLPKVKALEKQGRLKILVSVRDYPKIEEEFFTELQQALDQISEKLPARIYFAEFGRGDAASWRRVCRQAKHTKLWREIPLRESAEKVLAEVKKFDLVIGMRLHSLIAAELTGVPSIGLSYSRKITGLRKESLAIEGFKAEQLLKILNLF
ncbi:MAG: polysaccharide pyruvyl transferase family protein [Patescibacteria group bacterium]